MNRELTKKLLSLYRCTDEKKESMNCFMPMTWNNKKWCAATDAHQFIAIPENKDNELVEPEHKTVNIAAVIPTFDIKESVSIQNLISAFESIEFIKQEIGNECHTCDGLKVFYHDGHEYDCKTCNETGVIGTGMMQKVKNPKIIIQVGKAKFNSDRIKKLIEVINITNCQSLDIRYQKEPGLTMFELGNQILIGIASVYNSVDEDYQCVIVE